MKIQTPQARAKISSGHRIFAAESMSRYDCLHLRNDVGQTSLYQLEQSMRWPCKDAGVP